MDQQLWPRRARPEVTGPHVECELSGPGELRLVRARLRTWLAGELGEPAALDGVGEDLVTAVDELASNGLRHGRAPVRVCAVHAARWILLDVSDGDPQHGPAPAVGRDPALGGMGLRMVAHLTAHRGWTVTDDRKHVWACLPAG
jgi:anti-sigma regulatory factor (Ser/Thr protein kinase)